MAAFIEETSEGVNDKIQKNAGQVQVSSLSLQWRRSCGGRGRLEDLPPGVDRQELRSRCHRAEYEASWADNTPERALSSDHTPDTPDTRQIQTGHTPWITFHVPPPLFGINHCPPMAYRQSAPRCLKWSVLLVDDSISFCAAATYIVLLPQLVPFLIQGGLRTRTSPSADQSQLAM